jgi:hypothetical protein
MLALPAQRFIERFLLLPVVTFRVYMAKRYDLGFPTDGVGRERAGWPHVFLGRGNSERRIGAAIGGEQFSGDAALFAQALRDGIAVTRADALAPVATNLPSFAQPFSRSPSARAVRRGTGPWKQCWKSSPRRVTRQRLRCPASARRGRTCAPSCSATARRVSAVKYPEIFVSDPHGTTLRRAERVAVAACACGAGRGGEVQSLRNGFSVVARLPWVRLDGGEAARPIGQCKPRQSPDG